MLVAVLLGAQTSALAQVADHIWTGGPILTMNDNAMRAEAVAEAGGRILAVGTRADVMKMKGPKTRLVDLKGRTLLPGFVDAHGHVMLGGLQALSANLLAPPDGEVRDIPSLQDTVRAWAKANAAPIAKANLMIGFGYDHSQLKELRHPVREEVDAISSDIPVILVHQSGHMGAFNAKALALAGISADSKDPAGGVIRRKQGSQEPDGVLEEAAFFNALGKVLPALGPGGFKAFTREGAKLWASFGYTTAQEGRATPGTLKLLRAVGAEGGLPIDVVAYQDILVDRDSLKASGLTYQNRVRLGGAKLTIDGSAPGFTAWRDRPYFKPVGNYPEGFAGYPAVTPDQVFDSIAWARENGVQIITHANGERASDLLIAAHTAARGRFPSKDAKRPVLIHGQFLREDQVDSFKALGVIPSLFPMHTFYWGDWHLEHTVGPEAGLNISPTGWVRKRGMIFTSHHDAPVAFPDSMRVLDATVTRRARGSGRIVGPDQRVDVITALKAMTIWPAYQHFEEGTKGSLEPGKFADFVILSKDPTAVDTATIADIKVMETVKEGQVIFQRRPGTAAATAADMTKLFSAMAEQARPHGMPAPASAAASSPESDDGVHELLFHLAGQMALGAGDR
jgi:predicted amidohydrolase YtcJ